LAFLEAHTIGVPFDVTPVSPSRLQYDPDFTVPLGAGGAVVVVVCDGGGGGAVVAGGLVVAGFVAGGAVVAGATVEGGTEVELSATFEVGASVATGTTAAAVVTVVEPVAAGRVDSLEATSGAAVLGAAESGSSTRAPTRAKTAKTAAPATHHVWRGRFRAGML